ncbi:MAG: protein-glutamate O-methyltransferase CheR [Calditrichaeota bacterium]|nr:MAG: protein-glutamate O-methyltransferase CheR [Calditrichota bacterium]
MLANTITLSPSEYRKIATLVYERFGIALGENKESLVNNRLRKVLEEKGFDSFDAFYNHLVNDRTGNALDILINKISTNLTFFGREAEHFNFLGERVIPEYLKSTDASSDKKIRVWCAGCSTGEEAYTLSIVVKEALQKARSTLDYAVLATDISGKALAVAEKGMYKAENVNKLDDGWRKKYYEPVASDQYRVRNEIRNKVLFRRLNLMRPQFPFKNKFHVIFCRNVMIYFDQETRAQLTRKFHDFLKDDGYLFIGHSESLGRDNRYFSYVKPAVYKKAVV